MGAADVAADQVQPHRHQFAAKRAVEIDRLHRCLEERADAAIVWPRRLPNPPSSEHCSRGRFTGRPQFVPNSTAGDIVADKIDQNERHFQNTRSGRVRRRRLSSRTLAAAAGARGDERRFSYPRLVKGVVGDWLERASCSWSPPELSGEIVALGPFYTHNGMVYFVGVGEADYFDFIGDIHDPEVVQALLQSGAAGPGARLSGTSVVFWISQKLADDNSLAGSRRARCAGSNVTFVVGVARV